jgi:hypothetical protein
VSVAICTTTQGILHETAQAASRGRLMVVMGIVAITAHKLTGVHHWSQDAWKFGAWGLSSNGTNTVKPRLNPPC